MITADPAVVSLCRAASAGKRVLARGSAGASTDMLAAAVSAGLSRPVVYVVAHLDDADEALEQYQSMGFPCARFPALEAMADESHVSLELFAERLAFTRRLGELDVQKPMVLICPIQALMQGVPAPENLSLLCLELRPGLAIAPAAVVRWLEQAGYRRADAVEESGDFSVRGGIVDIFPPGETAPPVRLDFFGDQIDRLTEIDTDTMASDRAIDSVELICASMEAAKGFGKTVPVLDLIPRQCGALLHEVTEITEQARGYYERVVESGSVLGPPAVLRTLQSRFSAYAEVSQINAPAIAGDEVVDLPVSTLPPHEADAAQAVSALVDLIAAGLDEGAPPARGLLFCQNDGEKHRLAELVSAAVKDRLPGGEGPRIDTVVAYLHRGFVWRDAPTQTGPGAGLPTVLCVPYHELMGRFDTRRRRSATGRIRAARAMDTFLDFAPGDYVVHRDHGIALFAALRTLRPREVPRQGEVVLPGERAAKSARRAAKGKPPAGEADTELEEFLTLEFAGGARLHVPATKIDHVQKYIGGYKGKPPLSTLGGNRWKRQKEQVSESVQDLASELLRIRAAREHLPGVSFPADTVWQKEFEEEFPYEETDDQLAALAEIKRDMCGQRPMDRLLCGDVGYGKTELAIRAAFKAVEFGKQVAVLVPTTVLAEQHEQTFRSRFADYPFRVESLSRFKTTREMNEILADLRKGRVDIVIGTHRLLSKDVNFADLGLVVVDEEQRFGVEHKERLLALRMTVDVLTLSATPIPRTLHMSMLGLRDISSLATAPVDRRAVVTDVFPFNEGRIRRAIEREMAREGQTFFVHNRVHNIRSVADDLARLVPGARIVVGHGQMPPRELEEVMLRFTRREADILVSTTIIESGIDIPSANTMIINDADRFGLADLHQLRGRVGRYKHRAYCYLLTPTNRNVTEKALRRLKAVEEFSMLGAGFKIAMRDLEIRGAGNILGPEQSGHIAAVGYEMYCQLLDRAVKGLKNERVAAPSETTVEVGVTGVIPRAYIPSDQRRMEAYRRLAVASSAEELGRVESELTQAYGKPPRAVNRLLLLTGVRIAASDLGVRSIVRREKDIILRTHAPEPVAERLTGARGTVAVLKPKAPGETHEVYFRPSPEHFEGDTLLTVLTHRLRAAR